MSARALGATTASNSDFRFASIKNELCNYNENVSKQFGITIQSVEHSCAKIRSLHADNCQQRDNSKTDEFGLGKKPEYGAAETCLDLTFEQEEP